MILAFEFSARRGLIDANSVARVRKHLAAVGLPSSVRDLQGPVPDIGRLMTLISQDKKVNRGKLTFILVRGIGEAFVENDVDPGEVRAFLLEKLAGK
jgi:3-dehydroquinate synthetase